MKRREKYGEGEKEIVFNPDMRVKTPKNVTVRLRGKNRIEFILRNKKGKQPKNILKTEYPFLITPYLQYAIPFKNMLFYLSDHGDNTVSLRYVSVGEKGVSAEKMLSKKKSEADSIGLEVDGECIKIIELTSDLLPDHQTPAPMPYLIKIPEGDSIGGQGYAIELVEYRGESEEIKAPKEIKMDDFNNDFIEKIHKDILGLVVDKLPLEDRIALKRTSKQFYHFFQNNPKRMKESNWVCNFQEPVNTFSYRVCIDKGLLDFYLDYLDSFRPCGLEVVPFFRRGDKSEIVLLHALSGKVVQCIECPWSDDSLKFCSFFDHRFIWVKHSKQNYIVDLYTGKFKETKLPTSCHDHFYNNKLYYLDQSGKAIVLRSLSIKNGILSCDEVVSLDTQDVPPLGEYDYDFHHIGLGIFYLADEDSDCQYFIDVENPEGLIHYDNEWRCFIDSIHSLTVGYDRCVYLNASDYASGGTEIFKLNARGHFELVRDLSLQGINNPNYIRVFDEDHLILVTGDAEPNCWLVPLDSTKPLHYFGPSEGSLRAGECFPRKGGSFFEIQTSMGVYDIRENNTGELPKWCADLPEEKTPVEITVVEYKLKKELVEKPEEKTDKVVLFGAN